MNLGQTGDTRQLSCLECGRGAAGRECPRSMEKFQRQNAGDPGVHHDPVAHHNGAAQRSLQKVC